MMVSEVATLQDVIVVESTAKELDLLVAAKALAHMSGFSRAAREWR
jgi:hypothetical protein